MDEAFDQGAIRSRRGWGEGENVGKKRRHSYYLLCLGGGQFKVSGDQFVIARDRDLDDLLGPKKAGNTSPLS